MSLSSLEGVKLVLVDGFFDIQCYMSYHLRKGDPSPCSVPTDDSEKNKLYHDLQDRSRYFVPFFHFCMFSVSFCILTVINI